MKKCLYLLSPLLALFCSCEESSDDYRYPSVLTDYACLVTDASGQPETLLLDNGCAYDIEYSKEYLEAYPQLPSYKADTVYRVISVYELGADNVAYIYTLSKTISIVPTPLRDGEVLSQDPVYLQSCWISGGYLNMVIELKALDGQHNIGFVDTTPKGMKGKEITFYHYANNDVESYRQKLYSSIPLAPIALQRNDTLRFVVNTYDEGLVSREFIIE